jgi:transposase
LSIMNMHPQGGVASSEVRPNAGIDVSKQHLDACVGRDARRVPNDAQGWDELTAMLQAAKVDLVVVEATGGYERGLVCALQGAALTVARVNPRQARDFAKSMGVLAKTDQVDARTLRAFADVLSRHEQRERYITPMLEQARAQLAELMTRRRRLVREQDRIGQALVATGGAPSLTLMWFGSKRSALVMTAHRMRAFLLASAH